MRFVSESELRVIVMGRKKSYCFRLPIKRDGIQVDVRGILIPELSVRMLGEGRLEH